MNKTVIKQEKMIKKIFVLLFLILLFAPKSWAKHYYPEKYYQNQWCGKWNGAKEYRLKDKTRVDCVTKNYAVEFDFAPKWAESFGQAKYYAEMTGKKPAVILIIEQPSDWKYYNRLNSIARKNGVTLWYMKSPDYGKHSQNTQNINYKNMKKFIHKTLAI